MTDDLLPSWRQGPTKQALVDFVASVSQRGPGFVEPAERIATFDNDGTLWCEKPLYAQADFIFRTWKAMAAVDPSLAREQPYKAIVEGDRAWLSAILDHVPEVLKGIGMAFGGITTEEFETRVAAFFKDVSHPTFGRPYTEVGFRPMQELLAFLETNGFRVFICTGGGRDFVRVVSDQMYGIPRERVIGSGPTLEYREGAIYRTAGLEQPVDDGPGKAIHIWMRTGRHPLVAGGNADGDIEMLSQAKFALLVDHDDAEREFEYRTGAEKALAAANASEWTVVSMKDDWAQIF